MNRYLLALFLTISSLSTLCGQSASKEPPTTPRILIGSIINRRPEILKEFFLALDEMRRPTCSIEYYFVDDTKAPASGDLLQRFAADHDTCHLVHTDPKESPAFLGSKWRPAKYKNQIVGYAKENAYDYLFLVDSDIVVHPKTLEQLMGSKKEIIASVFWTSSKGESAPQVWLFDENTQFDIKISEGISDDEKGRRRTEFFQKLQAPGTYEVGGVRSCTLISKNVLQSGVSFQRINNVTFLSDDSHFCLRAAALGFSMYVDTHYPSYHIVRETGESSLAGVVGVKKGWKSVKAEG